MFKQLTPLKPAEHADLRIRPVQDYGFARNVLVAPIIIDEIARVAREYPIVFPAGAALPVALMGVQKEGNAYVASGGQWLANYVPAHIRHYPLAMAQLPVPKDQAGESEPKLAVLVDVQAECVSRTEGELLIGPDGKLSGPAQRRVRLMERMRARTPLTRALVRAIEEAGLLVEAPIRVQQGEGPVQEVKGVRVIHETALNQLEPAAFEKLRAAGALPLVYAALLSWVNFREGPIGRSHSQQPAENPMDNDVIRFS